MSYSLPLEKMTSLEKVQAMENIWDSLLKNEPNHPSPEWHKAKLEETEAKYQAGIEKPLSWDEAKKQLRQAFK